MLQKTCAFLFFVVWTVERCSSSRMVFQEIRCCSRNELDLQVHPMTQTGIIQNQRGLCCSQGTNFVSVSREQGSWRIGIRNDNSMGILWKSKVVFRFLMQMLLARKILLLVAPPVHRCSVSFQSCCDVPGLSQWKECFRSTVLGVYSSGTETRSQRDSTFNPRFGNASLVGGT